MSESSRGRGKKVVAPRGRGRRSQAERDQISQAERERNKDRDRQYAQEQNVARLAQERAERDRRRREEAANQGRGRGRGGFMGETNVKHESSGPLSGGSVISASRAPGKAYPRPWAPSNKPGASRTESSFSISGGASASGGGGAGYGGTASGPDFAFSEGIKEDAVDGGYLSSDLDEPEEGQRRPIEAISLLTDDEDDDGTPTTGFPIRLTRLEHRDRTAPVTTDAGEGTVVKVEEDGDVAMADEDGASTRMTKQRQASVEILEERPWRGVWGDADEPTIKEEPIADEPAGRARGKTKDDTDTGEQRPRRSRQDTAKHPTLFNEEERSEYARELEDDQVMLEEFGDLNSHKDDTRTYLFQFPPVLPNLAVQQPVTIKDDPDAPSQQSIPPAAGAANKDVPIKVEEDDPMDKKNIVADQTVRPKHLPNLASGAVGKLRVHKSGKVVMDWGGSSFVVQNGVSPQFLQNLVMVKLDEKTSGGVTMPNAVAGVATAFGQPRGKLVVQPDWDEMLEGGVKGLKVE